MSVTRDNCMCCDKVMWWGDDCDEPPLCTTCKSVSESTESARAHCEPLQLSDLNPGERLAIGTERLRGL